MRLPSAECPHCGARLNLVYSLGWQCPACGNRPRPWALWFTMVYSIMAAPVGVFVLASVLTGDPLVPADGEGRPLTGLAAELFPMAVFAALLPAAPTAYGLWHHRGWTRSLVTAWLVWIVVVLLPVVAGMGAQSGVNAVLSVVALPFYVMYLYASRAINEYYAAIAKRDEIASGG